MSPRGEKQRVARHGKMRVPGMDRALINANAPAATVAGRIGHASEREQHPNTFT